MNTVTWVPGNSIRLLENGEEYYPRVFEAIRTARHEVLIETFILFEDEVGMELHASMIAGAANGAMIDITVDGWGSCDLSDRFIAELAAAGVRLHRLDHHPRILGVRPHPFRRLHRKMVVVDGRIGFIGGINYAFTQLLRSGPNSKQDYAVEVRGPIVDHMRRFMQSALGRPPGAWQRIWNRVPPADPTPASPSAPAGSARAVLVTRDNNRHRRDIERHYRAAFQAARHRLIVANAYFLPGIGLLRQLARAARRGVAVDLVVQGKPDTPMAVWGSTAVYAYLIRAGVRVHEYRERPLHGKVAVMDEQWATVGSSNLDPFSLSLNLEANLVILDAEFNQELGNRLLALIRNSCFPVADSRVRHTVLRALGSVLMFRFLRWVQRLLESLPVNPPQVERAVPEDSNRAPPSTSASQELGTPQR